MVVRGSGHGAGRKFQKSENDTIRMSGLDSIRLQSCRREVLQVRGSDHMSVTPDSRSQNMAVAGIGQPQAFNQIFVIRDQRMLCVFIHQHSGPLEPLAREIGAPAQERPDPFLMYRLRPSGPKEPRQGEVHQ